MQNDQSPCYAAVVQRVYDDFHEGISARFCLLGFATAFEFTDLPFGRRPSASMRARHSRLFTMRAYCLALTYIGGSSGDLLGSGAIGLTKIDSFMAVRGRMYGQTLIESWT